MDRILVHMKYLRDNPPAGTMLKMFFESFDKKTPQQKPKFESEEDRKSWEKEQLKELLNTFGGGDINNLPKKPKRKMADLSKYVGKEVNNG